MKILLTNDDGIEAAGLHAVYDVIKDLGEVHVVAPARVQSATSHAITLHR
ncbi:MAG: 5'/3'-nucleotidase SurE, partial [Planctomycetota bacterium]